MRTLRLLSLIILQVLVFNNMHLFGFITPLVIGYMLPPAMGICHRTTPRHVCQHSRHGCSIHDPRSHDTHTSSRHVLPTRCSRRLCPKRDNHGLRQILPLCPPAHDSPPHHLHHAQHTLVRQHLSHSHKHRQQLTHSHHPMRPHRHIHPPKPSIPIG